MEPRLVTVVVEVADPRRTAVQYRDAFAVELHPGADNEAGDDRWISGDHAAVSWTDGRFLHLAFYAAKEAPVAGVQLGFDVDDLDAAHARAAQAGAEVVHPPRPEPWGATARYRDVDGNVVSLTQRRPAP